MKEEETGETRGSLNVSPKPIFEALKGKEGGQALLRPGRASFLDKARFSWLLPHGESSYTGMALIHTTGISLLSSSNVLPEEGKESVSNKLCHSNYVQLSQTFSGQI